VDGVEDMVEDGAAMDHGVLIAGAAASVVLEVGIKIITIHI